MTRLASMLAEIQWSSSGTIWSPEEDFGSSIACCPACKGAMPEQYELFVSKGYLLCRHHNGHEDDCLLKEALSIVGEIPRELSKDEITALVDAHLEHYKFLRAANGAGAPVIKSLMASYRLGISRVLQITGVEYDSIGNLFHAIDALGVD